ncbi:MAG: Lar family restriction alleviation protein [Candidatus Methanomethylophilaceae archaeon]|nr:Lar family restriction alleviation protein [Candidatus Methanomethylophilaceae archaeon]
MSYKVTMVISNLEFEPTDNDLYEIQYRAADWLCISPDRVEIKKEETNLVGLRSCPLCGRSPSMLIGDTMHYRIRCERCGIMTDADTRENVIEIWNRRVNEWSS